MEEGLPKASNILIAVVCWGCCTFTKWIGLVHFVFVVYYLLLKILSKSDCFWKLFGYLMLLWTSILVIILPLWTSMSWAPYLTHCNTRMDRTNQVPLWCLESFPNVYVYLIQLMNDDGPGVEPQLLPEQSWN